MTRPGVKRRVCVVSGSRADYGLLYWVIHKLQQSPEVELQLVATGMHLAPEFGYTLAAIEADGFSIAAKVDMLLSGDSPQAVSKSIGLGVIGFADAFARLRPDWLLVLGDRFEILAAVQAALIATIPIAHIAGGDTTEGAVDEAIRHAITKMAHLHLVTNEQSAARVRQMGEDPTHVHVVGSPGIDTILHLQLRSREQLSRDLAIDFGDGSLLVTFHPATLDPGMGEAQFAELLAALATLPSTTRLFFTMANADAGGRALSEQLRQWSEVRSNVRVFTSLGQLRYLSLMAQVDAVVGNSSSGLYEAPSLRIPTVDIGDRQRGRLAADSVVHCEPERHAIKAAIERALALDCSQTVNPYGDGHSAARIVQHLLDVSQPSALLKKRFATVARA